jgi:hypothetical protein
MFGKRAILPFVLIIMSIILFVLNISGLKEEDYSGRIYGLISNALLIFAMILVVIGNRKSSKEK